VPGTKLLGGEFEPGQQVAATMGGMGRTFDGGYAEYTCATKVHGVVCFTGMLSNEWTVRDFYPIDYLPTGCGSRRTQATPPTFPPSFLDHVAAGRLTVPIDRTYTLDEIATAHADMEDGNATGKLVVIP
jgi:NADPH:quinone reductase